MIRSNVGNVVTNAAQIESVAMHTARGIPTQEQKNKAKIADAASALNHLTMEEAEMIGKSKAASMIKNATESVDNKLDIDSLMEDTPTANLNSPEASQLNRKIRGDFDHKNFWTRGEKGRFRQATEEDFFVAAKRGEDNADV